MSDMPTAKIRGIFSERDQDGKPMIGSCFWFAREEEDGSMSARPLDDNFMPSGDEERCPKEEFLKRFFLEPELWYRHVSQRLAQGDYYRARSQHIEAKIEYNRVLAIDEENVRANFGLGLTYLAMNELEKARYVFERIVALDEAFTPIHKHLFNEFGIAMRKKRMFEMALQYYNRAVQVAPDDENIHVNVARACHEKGDADAALAALRRALTINPQHREAGAFLDYLLKNGVLPKTEDAKAFFAQLKAGTVVPAASAEPVNLDLEETERSENTLPEDKSTSN